ncbi:MAG: universal stress protein [Pseudomonadota bacterium]|nr:universal stress protein [Pseudomonadota bacterium]
MAIKSILVHVANDPRHEDRLNFAVDLCRHVAGHLEVVFTVDPITMPAGAAGRAASNAFLAEARAIAHERAETLRQTVADHFSGSDLSYEFQIVTGDQVKELARRAYLADLVIVGQSPFAGDDHVVVKKMENLVIHTGCPLLVLPFAGAYPGDMADFRRRILVAWDYGAPGDQSGARRAAVIGARRHGDRGHQHAGQRRRSQRHRTWPLSEPA